jgi:excisionase family DNA binding protein
MLTTDEAADYLGISKSYLSRLRCYGRGPRYTKVGMYVFYKPVDLDNYRDSTTKTITPETL